MFLGGSLHLLEGGGHRRQFGNIGVRPHQSDRRVGIEAQLHDQLAGDQTLGHQLSSQTTFESET